MLSTRIARDFIMIDSAEDSKEEMISCWEKSKASKKSLGL